MGTDHGGTLVDSDTSQQVPPEERFRRHRERYPRVTERFRTDRSAERDNRSLRFRTRRKNLLSWGQRPPGIGVVRPLMTVPSRNGEPGLVRWEAGIIVGPRCSHVGRAAACLKTLITVPNAPVGTPVPFIDIPSRPVPLSDIPSYPATEPTAIFRAQPTRAVPYRA